MASTKNTQTGFSVPGISLKDGHNDASVLQGRLKSHNDLPLTLKHAHRNVIGRNFIGVHLMLDPQVVRVRLMVDETAERIAALGMTPNGLPGALVRDRSWNDCPLGRAHTAQHLEALDLVFDRRRGQPPCSHRAGRKTRPGHRRHADQRNCSTRTVPMVHPRPPRKLCRAAIDRRSYDWNCWGKKDHLRTSTVTPPLGLLATRGTH
jgi:hypothetical protein